MSEGTGRFQITILSRNLNKLFTVMGGKVRFSDQDRDLEYLFWRSKNLPVPSVIIPPLCRAVARSENLERG